MWPVLQTSSLEQIFYRMPKEVWGSIPIICRNTIWWVLRLSCTSIILKIRCKGTMERDGGDFAMGFEPKAHAILGLSMSCCCSVIFSLLGFGVRWEYQFGALSYFLVQCFSCMCKFHGPVSIYAFAQGCHNVTQKGCGMETLFVC